MFYCQKVMIIVALMRCTRRKYFTLTELLITIAIIAILV